jgi:hypothetical protein
MDTTTYPASAKAEERATHAEYLALERDGKVVRVHDNDGMNHPHGAPFVIWRPVDEGAAPPAA